MSDDDTQPELVGTGRHLSPNELFVWTRFLDSSRLLEEMLANHLSRQHHMNHSDYEVLVRLDGFGGKMRMTELAKQVVSSAQKLTHTAKRLEQRGWIGRETCPDDGRAVLSVLLEPGRAALAEAAVEHAALIRRFLLDPLTPVEKETIGTAMDQMAKHMRAHRRGEDCFVCLTDEANRQSG